MAYLVPFLLLLLGGVLFALKVVDWHRDRKLKMGGWHIEFLSSNMLRSNSNEYAFIYRTANHEVWFFGIEGEKPLSARFLDGKGESRAYYEKNKGEIHARLKTELSRWPKCNFCVEDHE